jgi:L-cysteine S-thiosulfotransferase
MRKTASIILGASTAALLLGSLLTAPVSLAQGSAPKSAVCNDKENPPTDPAVQGGCIATDRTKGNCHSCHLIAGINYGDIAPPLVAMQQRFPDKAKLRAQVTDPRVANPNTLMPPFGAYGILSAEEIDKVVEFLLTL